MRIFLVPLILIANSSFSLPGLRSARGLQQAAKNLVAISLVFVVGWLVMAVFHISDHIAAEEKFHLAYGRALAQWAVVEQRMFFWFWQITGLPQDMSRAVFYSSKNFAGRADMLEAALGASATPDDVTEFLRSAMKKARQFSSFRNQLAHGETMFDPQPDSPNHLQTVLIDGKHNDGTLANVTTVEQIEAATGNFRELSRLIVDVLVHLQGQFRAEHVSPEKCTELVRALPNRADSQLPSPIQRNK
ncbi:MAG: hypothetical protein ACK4R3_02960 [Aliihoeflea sp.]